MIDNLTETEAMIDYINDYREDHDIKVARLATILGLERNTLGRYLNKTRPIPFYVVLRIARLWNLDISDICGIRKYFDKDEKQLLEELRLLPKKQKEESIQAILTIIHANKKPMK